MKEIYLSKKDIETILTIAKQNDIELFRIQQDSSSGIGSVTTMVFEKEFHYDTESRFGTVTFEISGVEEW